MKLDEFRSGRLKNKISTGLVLMGDEIENEIGFGSFNIGAAVAYGPSQRSQSAHFSFWSMLVQFCSVSSVGDDRLLQTRTRRSLSLCDFRV